MSRAAASCTLVAALASALAGCGSGGDAADDENPLDGYLNEIYGEYDPNAPDPDQIRTEELLAACMGDQGFEYYPVTDPVGTADARRPDSIGSLEFARQFGYGYTTESNGPGTGTASWSEMPEMSEAARRNTEYAASLSVDAQREYLTAQLGDYATPTEDMNDQPWDNERGGCMGAAFEAVDQVSRITAQFSAVQEAIDQLWTTASEDPRLGEAMTGWGSCMATAGYPDLVQFGDAENLVNDIVNRFTDATYSQVDLTLGETRYDAITASVPEELAAVQAQEIAIAVADATCREAVEYDRIHDEVQAEDERAFVDAHRDELDAWVDAVHAAEAEQDR